MAVAWRPAFNPTVARRESAPWAAHACRPAFKMAGAWYELGDGGLLHLILHPNPRTLRGTRDVDIFDGHLAFRIADYDGALAHLRAHGIACVELPQNATPWKQLFFTDPDGNEIELNVER